MSLKLLSLLLVLQSPLVLEMAGMFWRNSGPLLELAAVARPPRAPAPPPAPASQELQDLREQMEAMAILVHAVGSQHEQLRGTLAVQGAQVEGLLVRVDNLQTLNAKAGAALDRVQSDVQALADRVASQDSCLRLLGVECERLAGKVRLLFLFCGVLGVAALGLLLLVLK